MVVGGKAIGRLIILRATTLDSGNRYNLYNLMVRTIEDSGELAVLVLEDFDQLVVQLVVVEGFNLWGSKEFRPMGVGSGAHFLQC